MLKGTSLRLHRDHLRKLRDGSGVQWPCNNEYPDGTERLYAGGDFNTETDYCETYGRDLLTGAVQDWSRESEESR